eukprot:GHVT01090903.1.p1 GENE.GHVT01090903.1~~GHVT01090903.1.p1  ORF type:complete len:347 (-),score=63.05 GHVT01090903.1:258-1298(-)
MCAASSTLGSFLELPGAAGAPTCLLVNPLHHVNSSVLADWALGVQGAALELVERYTTSYWRVLCEVAETFSAACGSSSCDCSGSPRCEKSSLGQGPDRNLISECTLEPAASSSGSSSASRTSACRCSCHSCSRSTSLSSSSPPGSSSPPPGSSSSRAACASRGILVCPLVPRHMEYLEAQLCAAGPSKLKLFGVSRRRLAQAVEPRRVILLVGSAPCGPQTVNRFERLLDGKLPTIRYGSTETCLQVSLGCRQNFEFINQGTATTTTIAIITAPINQRHHSYLYQSSSFLLSIISIPTPINHHHHHPYLHQSSASLPLSIIIIIIPTCINHHHPYLYHHPHRPALL